MNELYPVVNTATPSPAYFKAVPITLVGAKRDKLGDLHLGQFTKLVNSHMPILAVFCTFQLSLEQFNCRGRKNFGNVQNMELLNFNYYNVKPPTLKCDDSATPIYNQIMCHAKDNLRQFTTALQHSYAQTFVLQKLSILKYTLMYENKVPTCDRTDPLWKDLINKKPITKGKHLGNYPANQKVSDFLQNIGYDKNHIEGLNTAILLCPTFLNENKVIPGIIPRPFSCSPSLQKKEG